MDRERFSELLEELAQALHKWGEKLPCDRSCKERSWWPANAKTTFDILVRRERLELITLLCVAGQDSLAGLIDEALNRIIEFGEAFVNACSSVAPPESPFWEDMSNEEILLRGSNDIKIAKIDLMRELWECWEFFATIDTEILREASSQRDDGNGGDEGITPVTYLPTFLCSKLDISNPSLNKYAKAAGVDTPGKGKRNHRYSQADFEAILQHVIGNVSDTKIVERARQMQLEIKSKSKDEK